MKRRLNVENMEGRFCLSAAGYDPPAPDIYQHEVGHWMGNAAAAQAADTIGTAPADDTAANSGYIRIKKLNSGG